MEVSILQWNVWFKEDIRNVARELQRFDADILCLQELTKGFPGQAADDTVEFLADRLGYHSAEAEISHANETWQQANAILSRFPIHKSVTHWIHEPLDAQEEQFRAYLEAAIDTGKGQLTVGTTHMSFSSGFLATDRKEREADQLYVHAARKPANYVLTGDFNELPESYTIRRLEECLRNAGPEYSQNTWTTKPYIFDTGEAKTLDWRLDYVFSSPDIQVLSAEILQTEYSDHLPIHVRLRLSNEPARTEAG